MSLAPKKYETLSEAVNALNKRGYTYDFQIKDKGLFCTASNCYYQTRELLITEVYRFEGISDPMYNEVVYAVESNDGLKGVIIDAYGAYSDEFKTNLLKDIPVKKRP
jgi:hypothetical protein